MRIVRKEEVEEWHSACGYYVVPYRNPFAAPKNHSAVGQSTVHTPHIQRKIEKKSRKRKEKNETEYEKSTYIPSTLYLSSDSERLTDWRIGWMVIDRPTDRPPTNCPSHWGFLRILSILQILTKFLGHSIQFRSKNLRLVLIIKYLSGGKCALALSPICFFVVVAGIKITYTHYKI